MTYGLWLSTAGLQTTQYRQEVMTHNLVNAGTVGFKHDLAVVQERPVESIANASGRRFRHELLDAMTGGAFVRPTLHSFEQGPLERTDNPLDLGIDGEGFFAVSDGKEVAYTRDGRFTVNAQGELVMVAGQGRYGVLDAGGRRIRLPDGGGGSLTISSDGALRQDGEEVARIGLVAFDDTSQLSKAGGNLYRNHGPEPTRAEGAMRSGHVEQSTFSPVEGLAQMIEISRAYELNARMISLQDQTIGQVISRVGRAG